MKRLVVFGLVVGFFVWRGKRLDDYERARGFGSYAPVAPSLDD